MKRTVGIFVFDDVEVLDFAGPFEVFSVAGRRDGSDPFEVVLLAETLEPLRARGNLGVLPHHTLEHHPPLDVLVVPGGGGFRPDGTPFGTRLEREKQAVLDWVRLTAPRVEVTLSVCTGALILARAGLTQGLKLTTHRGALEDLARESPGSEMCPFERVVDNGRWVFSGGISAGIDASFHLLERLLGREAALETARYMEYDWGGA